MPVISRVMLIAIFAALSTATDRVAAEMMILNTSNGYGATSSPIHGQIGLFFIRQIMR